MTAAFKPGDLVRLKSDGPLMTVKESDDTRIVGVWFASDGSYKEQMFIAATVEKVD